MTSVWCGVCDFSGCDKLLAQDIDTCQEGSVDSGVAVR